jgi:hypothetical protein
MAKRKTARPASRTRTPGAARTAKGARAGARATPKAATQQRKAAGAPTRKTAGKTTGGTRRTAKRAAASSRRTTPAAARKTAPAKARPRTIVTKRKAAPAARGGAARGASTSTPPRRDYGARGSRTRLQQIERDRRIVEEEVPTPPSSLDLDRRPSAARSGRAEMDERRQEHTAAGPDLTAGDVDADWEAAYNTGDEAPGGDMPTPDQAVVGEIGTAIGVEYADNEELKGVDKIEERDRHRWELDPASSEDYQDRARETKKGKGRG